MKALISTDEHAALPEGVSEHYQEQGDGRFLLQVEAVDGFSLEDVAGLKSSLAKERNGARLSLSKLKAFEGLDPSEAREALERLSDLDEMVPQKDAAEQSARREKKLSAKHEREIAAARERATQLQQELEKHLVEAAAVAALNKHGGSVELLLPHIQSSTRVEQDDDGRFVARVVDQDGHARISARTGSQDSMSIEELVEGMRSSDTFAPAFAGSGATGGGAAGTRAGRPAGGKHVLPWNESRDPAKYRAARERAQAAGVPLEIQRENR
tara:strand:+ start:377 stop:1183 length:807 start_codon:yes stop_codon:yes gene_type:complete